jgi:spore coat polysaccharide biosynthesis protein SpsF
MAFYPPVPQVEHLDWADFTGKRFVGWDWVLLRPQFAEAARRKIRRRPDSLPETPSVDRLLTLLVTMGGSDPAGLTLMALEAIEKIDGNFRVLVAIGGGFMHEPALTAWLAKAKRTYEIRRDVADMASLMAESDLAIASFGVTAYELAAVGVPAIYVCLTEDHAEAARSLVAEHAAISMGHYQKMTPEALPRVLNLAFREDCLTIMLGGAARCIDGLAAKRIATIIAQPCPKDKAISAPS